MKCWVINAKESVDRRQAVTKELEKLRIVPFFFEAIMGRELSSEQLGKEVHSECGLTLGEIGCAMSHLAIYRKLLSSDDQVALIFEDDIEIKPRFTEDILNGLVKYMESLQQPTIMLLYTSQHAYKQIQAKPISIYKAFTGSMSHAYLINRKAMQAILELQQPIHFAQDIYKYYVFFKDIDILTLDEDYIYQRDVESLIELERLQCNQNRKHDNARKKMYSLCFQRAPFSRKLKILYKKLGKALWEITHRNNRFH